MTTDCNAQDADQDADLLSKLLIACRPPLLRAEATFESLLDLDKNSWKPDGRSEFLSNYSSEHAERNWRNRTRVMKELRELRRQISDADQAQIESADSDGQYRKEGSSDTASKLLLIWLALYFNGTPYVELWQTIADHVSRTDGLPSIAFVMKAYGDVYRIERRRQMQFQRDWEIGVADGERPPLGILTVVDKSIMLDLHSYQAFEGGGRLSDIEKKEAKARRSARDFLSDESIAGEHRLALRWITERMARIYCSLQVLDYVCSRSPITVLSLHCMDETSESYTWGRNWLRGNSAGQSLSALPADSSRSNNSHCPASAENTEDPDLIPRLQPCVLSSYEGVIRNLGVVVGASGGRSTFSTSQSKLREDIGGYTKEWTSLLP